MKIEEIAMNTGLIGMERLRGAIGQRLLECSQRQYAWRPSVEKSVLEFACGARMWSVQPGQARLPGMRTTRVCS